MRKSRKAPGSRHLILPPEASALLLVLTAASVFTREQSPSCGPSCGPAFITFTHTHTHKHSRWSGKL